jgi:secondary thiamine-phosphate synthase enzyme
MHQHTLTLGPFPRGVHNITPDVARIVAASGARAGLAHIFVHHTSASLTIQESADPAVRVDLEAFLSRLVPDGDRLFTHTDEGPDDMSAHMKAALTSTSLSVPILDGRLGLGTWQALYLWEHRDRAGRRRVTVTVQSVGAQ